MHVTIRKSLTPVLLLTALFATLGTERADAQRKRRIAILSFELGDQATAIGRKNNLPTLSRDLMDKLTNKLVNDGKFEVVERAALDKIIKEQNLSNSDRFDTADAARIGKLAGVDDVIIGTMTDLTYDDKNSKGSVAVSIFAKGYVDHTVTIGVTTTARVIDVNTGGTPASGEGSAEAHATQKGVVITNGVSSLNSGFGSGLLAKATGEAIDKMVAQIEASPRLGEVAGPPRTPYTGTIADITNKVVIFSFEGKDPAKVGDTVEVMRDGKKIVDPKNPKRVLRVLHESLGTAKVTEVDAASSTATATYEGETPLKAGDSITYKPEAAKP